MNSWQVISIHEVEKIHQTSLRILSEVGIFLEHKETRDIKHR
jgi:trimethylamine:corrinoid methyltransferase-like protein